MNKFISFIGVWGLGFGVWGLGSGVLGLATDCLGSGSVQESGGHVSAPSHFWLMEGGLQPGYGVDSDFQSAVQAVQNNGGGGSGATNAWFRSTATVGWTPVAGTNTFNVPAFTFDAYGQAWAVVNSYSNAVNATFANYTPTISSGNLLWQYSPNGSITYKAGNFGGIPYFIEVYTNGVLGPSFSFRKTGLFIAQSFQGDGSLITSVYAANITNLAGTLPSNTIPQNLGVQTLSISSPSSANAVAMLGIAADGQTVVSNPVPAGSTPVYFISGTNTYYDQTGGSNRFNVPAGTFDVSGSALAVTSGYPWQVFDQPSSPVLTNLAGFNGQTAGSVITNLQVIQYATVQLTNAGLSRFTFTPAANGNSNEILILNTNYIATATATNIAQNATLIGGGWLFNLDANNTVWMTNSLSGAAPAYGFQTNGQLIVGQKGGATLQLGMLTNNLPSLSMFPLGNGSIWSATNGIAGTVSNQTVLKFATQ